MNDLGPIENLKNVHPPPRKAPLNRGWMLKSNTGTRQNCLNAAHILPNTAFRGCMSENRMYEKLDLIAKRTQGVFVSSALVSSKDESSSWVKFQQKYPDMFTVVFADKAKIYQGNASFFRFFYADRIPKKFISKKEIITEILHSSFVLDIGKEASRVENKVYLKDKTYLLDTFVDVPIGATVITLEERKRAFQKPTEVYIPKNLKSKWGRLCLQRFNADEELLKEKTNFEINPELAKSYILKGI